MYIVCLSNSYKPFLLKYFNTIRLAYKYVRRIIKKVDCVDVWIWEYDELGFYNLLKHFAVSTNNGNKIDTYVRTK